MIYWIGTGKSWMFSSSEGNWTDAYDWSGTTTQNLLLNNFFYIKDSYSDIPWFEVVKLIEIGAKIKKNPIPTKWPKVYGLINFSIMIISWCHKFCCIYQGEKDDKIIAVCADDPEYRHYTDINQLPPHRLAEIRRFFEDCILMIFQSYMRSLTCFINDFVIW